MSITRAMQNCSKSEVYGDLGLEYDLVRAEDLKQFFEGSDIYMLNVPHSAEG